MYKEWVTYHINVADETSFFFKYETPHFTNCFVIQSVTKFIFVAYGKSIL